MASRIKIGMVNYSINMLDHWAALDLGLYREEGLDVELIGSQPTREVIRTLESGEVTVSSFTSRIMDAILKEKKSFRFVLFTRKNPPHYIVTRAEIKSAQDLKGKTIWSGGRGGTNYYMTLDWLRENGLDPGSDVKLRNTEDGFSSFSRTQGLPEWSRHLLRGAYDAIMVLPLERELLEREAGYHTLVELCDRYPDRMIHGLAAHVDVLKREADTIRRAVRAHARAARLINEDKEKTAWCIMQRWGVTRQVAESCWETMRGRFMAVMNPSLLLPEIEYYKRHIEEHGMKVEAPDPESLVDRSFCNSLP